MHPFVQNKNSRRFLSFFLSLAILCAQTPIVSAGLFGGSVKVPSPNQAASDLEKRYHIDMGSIQEQGETLNVADQKKVTPEVSIFFSPSDPKEGEKLTARAFPTYFSAEASKLYFTWFVQRAGCVEASGPLSADIAAQCDLDGNGRVNQNDWKIQAHRILASNDFDFGSANYGADTDADGYTARMGGDNRVNIPNHCYVHDNASGENYEIVSSNSSSIDFDCANGFYPVCMVGSGQITPTAFNTGLGVDPVTGDPYTNISGTPFTNTDSGDDYSAGSPICRGDGTVACNVGTPCCAINSQSSICSAPLTSCSGGNGAADTSCQHLFPAAPGHTVGDGAFGAEEERFWQTDPNDPDTADNGNKDEANVAGLGRDNFMWNYAKGDKVGVVVEGTSMIATKYQDSSNMIMWAFSKNKCDISGGAKGSFSKSIKGYSVIMPVINFDLNDCIKDNLVDPTEGGQATNLELSMVATPDDPLNDVTSRGDGDLLEVLATVENAAQNIQSIYYDWRVELSSDGTANPAAGWVNITSELNNLPNGRKLVSQVRGNGVNKVQLNLNMQGGDIFNGRAFGTYLSNDMGYLRFRLDAVENFGASGASRKGRSTVIVKFNSSQDRILAHIVSVSGSPARLSLVPQEICTGNFNPNDPPEQQALSRLDSKFCRVIKNEIIGLEVSGNDLTNFNWTINGQPLVCNTRVSNTSCFDDRQGNVNFFPVIGKPGDTFNITVTANRLNTTISTDKLVTITRTFSIVQPQVLVVSADENAVWQKTLGQYVDTSGIAYTELSKDTMETIGGNNVPVRALFTPDFLALAPPPLVERSWKVDQAPVGDGSSNAIAFTANKLGKAVYNVSVSAVYRPNTLIRQAMQDIWGVSALDSIETFFSNEVQVEQADNSLEITQTGVKKYYALVSSYLPASLLFSLKVLFSMFLILFASGLVFAVIPNMAETPVPRRRNDRF